MEREPMTKASTRLILSKLTQNLKITDTLIHFAVLYKNDCLKLTPPKYPCPSVDLDVTEQKFKKLLFAHTYLGIS